MQATEYEREIQSNPRLWSQSPFSFASPISQRRHVMFLYVFSTASITSRENLEWGCAAKVIPYSLMLNLQMSTHVDSK